MLSPYSTGQEPGESYLGHQTVTAGCGWQHEQDPTSHLMSNFKTIHVPAFTITSAADGKYSGLGDLFASARSLLFFFTKLPLSQPTSPFFFLILFSPPLLC